MTGKHMAFNIMTGEYYEVDAPVIPVEPPVLSDLFPKEFWRGALSIGITEESLLGDIDAMDLPEDQKEDLRIAVRKSTSFKRTDPDLIFMLNAKGFDASQIDTLWLWVLNSREAES